MLCANNNSKYTVQAVQTVDMTEICALKQFDAHVVQLRLNHSLDRLDRGKEGLNTIKAAKDAVFGMRDFICYLLLTVC